MARIRTIKPELFRHERLFDAERASRLPLRLAFAGLFTAADREGRFNWAPRALKLDCLPYDDCDFEEVLVALHGSGFIQKYEVEGKVYGVIPSWSQHQHVNVREAQSTIPEPTDASMCAHVQARGEGKGKEGERKGRDISTRDASVADENWKKFKEAYPKRGGANPWQPARKVFEQAVKSGHDPTRIINSAKAYAAECDKNKITATDKVAQALTWLRQARFDDYAPTGPAIRMLAPYSEEWQAERLAKDNRGEDTRFMESQAEQGNGWPAPPEPQREAAE